MVSIFKLLCNQFPELFITKISFFPPPGPWHPLFYFLFLRVLLLQIPHASGIIQYNVSFQHNVLKVHACRSMCQNFLPFLRLKALPPYGYTAFHLAVSHGPLGSCYNLATVIMLHKHHARCAGFQLTVNLMLPN